jgi:hypothetical protein
MNAANYSMFNSDVLAFRAALSSISSNFRNASLGRFLTRTKTKEPSEDEYKEPPASETRQKLGVASALESLPQLTNINTILDDA